MPTGFFIFITLYQKGFRLFKQGSAYLNKEGKCFSR